MSWNHRVLAHFQEGETEPYFMIHEVYYDENGTPDGYTTEAVRLGSEELKGLRWTLNKMKECLSKPILYAGDRFPEEYLPNTAQPPNPLYVQMKDMCLRLCGNNYYRDAGDWEVGFAYKNGTFISVSTMGHMNGIELIECSEYEWRRDNGRWVSDSTKAFRKLKLNENPDDLPF